MVDSDARRAISSLQQELGRRAQAEQQRQREEQVRKMQEAEIWALSTMFDKAAAYTNVFIIGGYAAYWGLWTATKSYLNPLQVLVSALLMLVSIVTFVFFEVYKQYRTSMMSVERWRILNTPENQESPEKCLLALKKFRSDIERANVGFVRFWHVTFCITVGAAIGALTVLGTALVYRLIGGRS